MNVRPLTECAANRDRAVVTDDDPVDDRKTETGALTGWFGREVRIEDAIERRLIDPRTGVGHDQPHVQSFMQATQSRRVFDGQRHGVERDSHVSAAVRRARAPRWCPRFTTTWCICVAFAVTCGRSSAYLVVM